MKQEKPTKLRQLIQTILWRTGPVARLRLAKLIYLIDWEHYKQTGEPISDAFYLREKRGPVPASLARDLSRMNGYEVQTSRGRADAIEAPGKRPRFKPTFGTEELRTIEQVLRKYAQYGDSNLLLAVYATPPMKALLREERTGALRRHEPVYLKKYAPTVPKVTGEGRSLQDLSARYAAIAKQFPAIADEDLSDEDILIIVQAYAESLHLMKTAEEIIALATEGGHAPETS